MDRLSRFATDSKVTEKTINKITEGLDSIANVGQDILVQSQLTHIGHEQELWGRRFRKSEDAIELEELTEEEENVEVTEEE